MKTVKSNSFFVSSKSNIEILYEIRLSLEMQKNSFQSWMPINFLTRLLKAFFWLLISKQLMYSVFFMHFRFGNQFFHYFFRHLDFRRSLLNKYQSKKIRLDWFSLYTYSRGNKEFNELLCSTSTLVLLKWGKNKGLKLKTFLRLCPKIFLLLKIGTLRAKGIKNIHPCPANWVSGY